MVNFDEIEFLESEIVEDDADAPVGTLVHISDDGTVEEITPEQESATLIENEIKDVEDVENDNDAKAENSQPITDETTEDITQDTPEEAEQIEKEIPATSEPVYEESDEIEQHREDIAQETTVDTQSEQIVENQAQEIVQTPIEEQDEAAIEQTDVVEQDTQPVQETVEEPVTFVESIQEESIVDEQPVETTETVQEAIVDEQPKEAAPKKTRKKAVKKETSQEPAPAVKTAATGINLKNGRNVNDALFDTSFEIEQPAKTKVVSTKKKQEKTQDIWAVAVVSKPTKATTSKPIAEKAEDTTVVPVKKSASKKSTKVENTSNTSTEEKKVAKATEKSAKDQTKTVKADAKETKAENAKPAKAAAKEEKTVKAKAPVKEEAVKEEKTTKATTKADSDETVIVEGEGKTHGKYVIKKTDKGNFVFKLYSSNYRVVAIGAQAYTTLGAAKIGVQSVINNAEKAPVENQTLKNYETLKFPKWEIYLDKKGEYRLRLYATNGSLIATTNDGYTDISGAKNGIAAVGRASKGCAIVRNDNLW